MRVLVVDDDFMVARVHAAFVQRTPGFSVVGTAHTGAEALTLVRELQPDVVLLDVYLPDTTGLDVLQQLRASEGPEAHVDVLMVTAANDVESVRKALHGGAASYLIKPFAYDDLRIRLEQLHEVRGRLAGRSDHQQKDLDRLFAAGVPSGHSSAPSPLPPKGLSPETAALVHAVVRAASSDGVSASECAEQTGLSRVSARRYLEHLVTSGLADVSARYGGTGRPERRFRPR